MAVTASDLTTSSDSSTASAHRIVVGVDGSSNSLTALRWALDEGDLRHSPVHVLLSWSMPPILGMSPVVLPS